MHPVAWVGWLGAALFALSAIRNPLHLILVLFCIAIVYAAMASKRDPSFTPISPVRFALVVILFSALFNAATVHFGETVLVRLPAGLPLIGGPITLESLVFGIINGLVLAGIFAAFSTLNRALPISSLIRLIPRAFYPVAVVISIAVTFVPTTLRQFRRIREAQAVRGHRVRGLRDWLPLFMPLLIGGLERALQLAEAMTARGFATADTSERGSMSRIAILVGLVALVGGWLLRQGWGQEIMGPGLMLAGAGLIVGALWTVGRRIPRTTYRPETWTVLDWIIVSGAAVALAVLVLPGLNQALLFYSPYPKLTLPGFNPVVGVGTLGLLGPAFPVLRI
jgi:energy-coupling factor transport system permease protein